MIPLFLDTETYSEVPITQGTYKYAENAEIILWQYAIGDGEVVVEDYLSDELKSMLLDAGYEKVIHNSMFDRNVIKYATGISIPTSQILDTMVCAMAHSLPGSLGQLCEIFNIDKDLAKDTEGKKLINLFCKPQKTRNGTFYRAKIADFPEKWEAFRQYGKRDITAMRELYKILPRWNFKENERKLWELDQKINDRGVAVDLDLCRAALRACAEAKKNHDAQTLSKTNGEVTTTARRDSLLEHIEKEYDEVLPDLTSATVKQLLAEGKLPDHLLELLAIRLDASKTSTSKYKRVLSGVNSDGRLRGLLQFVGALRTGRWSGRLFQPQNLVRSKLKEKPLAEAIKDLKAGAEDLISGKVSVMEMCASALRSVIIAPEGKKLVIADLSNIEGRILAWLANEAWKLKAFADYDRGVGADLYKIAYAKSFGIPVTDVDKDMRQIGKVMELALGYGGGIGAWITFAKAFNIDIEALAVSAFDTLPGDIIEEATGFLVWYKKQKKNTHGLSDKAFIVCDGFKRMWRQGHSRVQSYWGELEDACRNAINNPDKKFSVGMHKVMRNGSWLRISLPSGRCLCYPSPAIDDQDRLSYMGIDQFTRKWSRIVTYGGKLAENITQADARDVLAYRMLEIDAKGYEIVLTVHDEIVAETPDTEKYTYQELEALMATAPNWSAGLPLAAEGFESAFYMKKD